VEGRCLQELIHTVEGLSALGSQRLSPEEVDALLQEARGGDLTAPPPSWLLRIGVNPDAVPLLLESISADGLKVELGAGSGLGMAWTEQPLEGTRVEALRALCQELGGHLTVLRQPPGAGLAAWGDAPAKRLIEAVKQQFDPQGQLAPGRLPGVRVPAQPVVTR
jgi:glycolate oxidase FAD binding subunit